MTLWSIFRSPLMFGGDLPSNDAAMLALLTNPRVLAVNRSSTNGRQLFRRGDLVGWMADDPATGNKYLALFNAQDQEPAPASVAAAASPMLTRQQPQATLDVNITGAQKLYLLVRDGGDGSAWDHADWLNPTLYTGATAQPLTAAQHPLADPGLASAIAGPVRSIARPRFSFPAPALKRKKILLLGVPKRPRPLAAFWRDSYASPGWVLSSH